MKSENKTVSANFLIKLRIPLSMWKKMSIQDRIYVRKLAVHSSENEIYQKHTIMVGDILRVKKVLSKYDIHIRYPPAKEMKKFGINYTGDSLEISKSGDVFVINQYFPDGAIRRHNIPEERVWTIFYRIDELQRHLGRETIYASELWEAIARYYQMGEFFHNEIFDKHAFIGSRGVYHTFYYLPIKILEQIGKIDYTKRGEIRLLTREEIKKRRKARTVIRYEDEDKP